ncbi:Sugar transporter ERD6-like 16 [Abeliophyllum distichum]|uniref:Sugar transporter ERD6-like 16 n=1 Tax=Abeliophyllum distichum TaxID=126358 RepID=A0ABD1VCK8_9LAMI
MAIDQYKDLENGIEKGLDDLQNPLIQQAKCVDSEGDDVITSENNGSIWMVLISTFVAVCGSFEFGSCVGYSAPAQSAIRQDLNLTLAEEAWSLDVGRFSTGYGIGIFSFVLMIVCGASTAYLLGTVVTWRTLALTGLLPCAFLLVGLFFIPESPRWLAKMGLKKEFELALHRLRGRDADVSQESAEIQASIDALQYLPKARLFDLFNRKYKRSLIIGVGLMVFQQFGGINGIGFYASETFVAAGFSSGKLGTIAYAIIQLPITLLGAILMDKLGRRPLLMISSSGTFLGCFLAGSSFFLKSHGQGFLLEWVPVLAVSGVLVYIASFSIGMGAVPWVIMSEIFPIHMKGLAGSLVVLVNWLGAWAVSYTFNFIMSWSSTGTFMLYAGFCALTILFVVTIVPETKGKTLEQIQASINS